MEVHHEHHHTPPGKQESHWKHYIMEFLMLFLAVSAGFYVENYRDHRLEKERELQYANMLVADLKSDTALLVSFTFPNRRKDAVCYDSLYLLLHDREHATYGDLLYKYAKITLGYWFFIPSTQTIQQLKNSGNMRLIENPVIVDSILEYDKTLQEEATATELGLKSLEDYKQDVKRIFDNSVFYASDSNSFSLRLHTDNIKGNPQLINDTPENINLLYGDLRIVKRRNNINGFFEKIIFRKEKNLIALLQKEYHLKK